MKSKKLLSGELWEVKLIDLQSGESRVDRYDSILIEDIPENLTLEFWESLIHWSRVALKEKGLAYIVLPRKGKILLPYEILRENEVYTIYKIAK